MGQKYRKQPGLEIGMQNGHFIGNFDKSSERSISPLEIKSAEARGIKDRNKDFVGF